MISWVIGHRKDGGAKLSMLLCASPRFQGACVLLLQDLLQSCSRGGGRRVQDMCYERRRTEACVDESAKDPGFVCTDPKLRVQKLCVFKVFLLQDLCDFVKGGFVVMQSSTGPRKRFREMNADHVGGHD
jgi:hypothetical protein